MFSRRAAPLQTRENEGDAEKERKREREREREREGGREMLCAENGAIH